MSAVSKKKSDKKDKIILNIQRTLCYIVLIIISILCLFSFYVLLINTTRSHPDIQKGFSLIPGNSKATSNEVPEGAFSLNQRRALVIVAIIVSLIAWIWAFVLLGNSHSHPAYFVAGHVMVGLACICTSLIALVATIARQIRNDYSEKERNKWPKLVLLMGSISFVWGLFVILADSGSANGTTGYIMLGLGLVCYSISSKVILLAKIWRQEFKLANRIPMIPVLTALACLFLAAFVFELATIHADYFIPARVLVGLGAICFTLFSIVSILESGTSSK